MVKAAKLSKDDVLRLAKLARLELTMDEVERYTHQLGEVLGYVSKLQELKAAEASSAATLPVAPRADEVAPWPDPAALITQAAHNHDNLVEVPAVFDDRE